MASLLSPDSGLSSTQRAKLVAHSLSRACVFGELSVLQYLIFDPQVQPYVDLGIRDEDGLGLIALVIQGFGADSDRDVEREECVRLLIAQGADLGADKGDFKVHILSLNPYLMRSSSWLDASALCYSPVTTHTGLSLDDSWMFPVYCDSPKSDAS